jgi:hypothetical protein
MPNEPAIDSVNAGNPGIAGRLVTLRLNCDAATVTTAAMASKRSKPEP